MSEYYGISTPSSDFFMHYGVKGMKWGVRKKDKERISKNTYNGKMYGRDVKLQINMDNYHGEKITKRQKEIKDSIKDTNLSSSLSKLKQYIKDNDSDNLVEFDPKDREIANPFRYIKPRYIYIPRYDHNNEKEFHVMCDYRFDPEHGLAITYGNKKCKRVIQQDYVL